MEKMSIKRPWKFDEAVVDACRKALIVLGIEEIMMSLLKKRITQIQISTL